MANLEDYIERSTIDYQKPAPHCIVGFTKAMNMYAEYMSTIQ